MPYEVIWEDRGLYYHHFGVVTGQEITRSIREFYDDPRSSNTKYIIWDASDIDQLLMDEDEVTSAAAYDKGGSSYLQGLRFALVAKDEHARKLSIDYIDICRDLGITWEFKLFDDIEDARSWVLP